jgi:hypothetical protein
MGLNEMGGDITHITPIDAHMGARCVSTLLYSAMIGLRLGLLLPHYIIRTTYYIVRTTHYALCTPCALHPVHCTLHPTSGKCHTHNDIVRTTYYIVRTT